MHWHCHRGCDAGGHKAYASAAAARRYASAFDRDDMSDLGRRAPLFGLFPLKMAYWLRRSAARHAQRGARS